MGSFHRFFYFLLILTVILSFSITAQQTQYRRGTELQNGYQTYEQKYQGKDLNEEKRRLFPLESTGVWTELNPKVPRVDYLGIHFVNTDTGWACGVLGTIIKTTDGGESWVVGETSTTTPILKIRSYDGAVAIASGFDGMIFRSTDGGDSWTQIVSGVTGDLWGLEMINDTLGWSCGNANSLIKTTNGGETWQTVTTPGYTSDYWWIDFLNENYGLIAANGKILRTTDGGETWEIIQAGDSYPLFSIDVIDSLHIAAAGYGGTSYPAKNIYSTDGGNTWINGGSMTTSEINCIKYISVDTGYAVMSDIGLWKTTDRGQNWAIVIGIGEYELQYFTNERVAYNAGTGLKLWKAEGDLDVWHRLIINDNFADVFFTSEQKGFAISGISSQIQAVYKTTNGGIYWASVPGAPGGNDLLFLDSLTGFIGSNQIYKTTDGGINWYVPNGGEGGAGKIFFINPTIGWAIRSNTIYKTTDRGENWPIQFSDPYGVSFRSIFFLDSLDGWVIAMGYGGIYNTTDGGANWIRRTDIEIYDGSDIYFNDSTGFIINFLNLQKTSDSGYNWFTQFTSQYIIRTIGWLTQSHGFIMGDGIYETTDSGDSWSEIVDLRNIGLRELQAPKEYLAYAIGYEGLIYKYEDTTYVPIELISFTAEQMNNNVLLNWTTGTETNNKGFEVERSQNSNPPAGEAGVKSQKWDYIGFVKGNGTTTEMHLYSFTDNNVSPGKNKYRLKQIDLDGSFEYSKEIEVVLAAPSEFALEQNYPNPFNPATTIKYAVPKTVNVELKVFDILGREVKTLVNETKDPGYYEVQFNAGNFASGIYFYRLKAGEHIKTGRMLLLR